MSPSFRPSSSQEFPLKILPRGRQRQSAFTGIASGWIHRRLRCCAKLKWTCRPKPDAAETARLHVHEVNISCGVEANQALVSYYRGRKIWRVDLQTSILPN